MGLGRRAENAQSSERCEVRVVGCLKKEEGKGARNGSDARFLYPAKAAAGPCTRLA